MGSVPTIEKYVVETRVNPGITQEVLSVGCFNGRWGNCEGTVGYTSILTAILCARHAARAGVKILEVPPGGTEGTTKWEVTRWENVPSIGAQIRGLLEGMGNLPPLRCPVCGKEIPPSRSSRNSQHGLPELEFRCPDGHEFIVAIGEKIGVPA